MLLLIDAGNTRLKLRLYQQKDPRLGQGLCAVSDVLFSTHGQVGETLLKLKQDFVIEEVLVSSVAGDQVNELINQHFPNSVRFATVAERACGVINTYQSMATLGVDRWVAAVGAVHNIAHAGKCRIVVDAGTAVTVDLVDGDNHYLGGVIMPGARLMHAALIGNTAGVRASVQEVESVIGSTTEQCVNAGLKYGSVGGIERVISQMIDEIGANLSWQVFLTGGDAPWLSTLLRVNVPIEQNNNLIFDGLLNLYASGELN